LAALSERLGEDLKNALKAGDSLRVSVIRFIRAAAQNRQIELRRPLDDAEWMKVLSAQSKQRQESIREFEAGGRADLAEKERRELDIVREYLPPALSDEDLSRIVRQAIAETGARSPKEMGTVMKVVMPRVVGQADGKAVQKVVQSLLEGGAS
jgi:uncharacterized protein YqeY